MINILLCGNKKVFDGAITQLLSIVNRTKEPINYYIFTMDVTRIKEDYVKITDNQIELLKKIATSRNQKSNVKLFDVTDLYEQEFKECVNENAYCTPYTLLRLLADKVDEIPDKILYLDADVMANSDISELYNIDVSEYEFAAVKEKYGSWLIASDYFNAGVLLLNMKLIKKTGLFEKARKLLRESKLIFADQDALYYNTIRKLILPRKFNEQSKFNRKSTVLCHFCKRLVFKPFPHTENIKQWNIDKVHKIYKCHVFDKDLEEYKKIKENYYE